MTNIHKLSGVSSVVDFDKLALLVELQFDAVGQLEFVALSVSSATFGNPACLRSVSSVSTLPESGILPGKVL